jgi:hypothetical protein
MKSEYTEAMDRCSNIGADQREGSRKQFACVRDRHRRTVGFIESAMPADGILRCPFTLNGDVGTARLEEQL